MSEFEQKKSSQESCVLEDKPREYLLSSDILKHPSKPRRNSVSSFSLT